MSPRGGSKGHGARGMPVSRRTKVLICCTLGLAAVTLTRLPSLRRQAAIGAGPTTAPTDAPRAAPESHDSMDAAARDAAGPTFGLPTQLDPTGRSGLRRLDVSGPRRVLLKIGEWHELPPKPTEFAIGGMGWKRFPDEFCESSAARIGDAVYVIGGFLCDFNHVTDKVQILNRTTGEWRTAARLPETAAKTHQGAAAQTVAEATWLYLVSGQLGPGCTLGTAESWALKMHKRKAVWVRLPDLPEVRYAPSAFVDAGHLHVVGGAGPNRQDPRPEHWVLPLLESGRPAKAGWFDVGLLPGGGADSCGSATSRGYTFRFGGQHGHPHAVNVLTDNNAQCQDSPEVAHTLSMRRKLGDLGDVDWRIIAPLPWPASHVGLSTVAHGDNVLVVSGKDGKGATPRGVVRRGRRPLAEFKTGAFWPAGFPRLVRRRGARPRVEV
ncbi:hypothetical protein M885DRAFT_8438 [Pelagophyceae sp. CCMP2097]|nr:hypothetical protein M885DRAFT_8438 [Pelagophyceae sp. CCMP2097]